VRVDDNVVDQHAPKPRADIVVVAGLLLQARCASLLPGVMTQT